MKTSWLFIFILSLGLGFSAIYEANTPSSRCPATPDACQFTFVGLMNHIHFHPTKAATLLKKPLNADPKKAFPETYNFLNQLHAAEIPVFFQDDGFTGIDPKNEDQKVDYTIRAVDVTLIGGNEYFAVFPGGTELLPILFPESPLSKKDFAKALQAWTDKYIPGYKLDISTGERPSGFIEEAQFYEMISNKVIAIGNHHDLITHLLFYTRPEYRQLSEKLAKVYLSAQKAQEDRVKQKENYPGIILEPFYLEIMRATNNLWEALQELVPTVYRGRDSNRQWLTLGGYNSVVAPMSQVDGEFLSNYSYHANFLRILTGTSFANGRFFTWAKERLPEETEKFEKDFEALTYNQVIQAYLKSRDKFIAGAIDMNTMLFFMGHYKDHYFEEAYLRAKEEFGFFKTPEELTPEERKTLVLRQREILAQMIYDSSDPTAVLLTPEIHFAYITLWIDFFDKILKAKQ